MKPYTVCVIEERLYFRHVINLCNRPGDDGQMKYGVIVHLIGVISI